MYSHIIRNYVLRCFSFCLAISSDSEEEDESIGTGATMVDCPPLLDSTAWKDSNYEVTCTVLHAKIVQVN